MNDKRYLLRIFTVDVYHEGFWSLERILESRCNFVVGLRLHLNWKYFVSEENFCLKEVVIVTSVLN